MDSVELIINLAIIGLLIPTIVYAYRLPPEPKQSGQIG